jgi:adenylate cyclase
MTGLRDTVYTFVQSTIRLAVVFFALVSAITAKFVYNTTAEELTMRAAEQERETVMETAARLEASFHSAYADALTLLELNWNATGGRQTTLSRQAARFFEMRPEFAALVSEPGTRVVNETFFRKHDISENTIDYYMEAERELLQRTVVAESGGIYTMLPANASPYFGVPVIALFFKLPESDILGRTADAAVFTAFFSADVFSRMLGDGADITFLVNIRDDILLHTDSDIVLNGRNYWQEPFVRIMRTSGAAGMDAVFEAADGKSYLGAFQKLSIAGTAVLCETDKNSILGALRRAGRKCFVVYGAALAIIVIFMAAVSTLTKRYVSRAVVEQENNILEHYRIRTIFRALPESRKNDAALNKIPLDGENKDVTVVYAALGMSGRKPSPQKTLEALNSVLPLAIDSFTKTGGAADTVDGDGLTGVWGGPFSEDGAELDAVNAIRGALLLRAAFTKQFAADSSEPPTPVCCGINSGVMLAGQVGLGEHAAYKYTGSTSRTARLTAALNKRFGTDILIGESTMKLAGKYFITEELPQVRVMKKKIRVFAVINVKVTKSGVEQPKPANMSELRQMLHGVL